MLSALIESITNAIRRLFGGTPEVSTTSSTAPKPLPCPNSKELRATQTIGPEGGTLVLGEHRLVVPKEAVPDKVSFTGVLLEDKILKVQLKANNEDSYQFRQPAALTLHYGRCEPTEAQRLHVYKIDPATNRVIKDLGGKVDEREKTVTAALETLSTYTLGIPI